MGSGESDKGSADTVALDSSDNLGDEDGDPRIGEILDNRYRVVEELGVGGMGIVYRGERLQLGRHVAIKFLHTSVAQDKDLLARFEREAKAMSRLGHPHCVSVIDFGVSDAPYIVMDYVTGKNLRDTMDAGSVGVARSLHIMRQTLAGLAHAHGHGIVHRDVKPRNIMLTEATGTGDHVRILDFGLAKLRGEGSVSAGRTGMVLGTPSYMSPEQARGMPADATTDVYSAGVLLFELLTGRKPFVADGPLKLLRMHCDAPIPRLGDIDTDEATTNALNRIVTKAMAKHTVSRYATAMEFADALEPIERQLREQSREHAMRSLSAGRAEDPDATPVGKRQVAVTPQRRGSAVPLVAILVLGAAGAAAW